VDISAGGACVLGERSIEQFDVMTCQFLFPGVPVPVPVLVQVRWIQPSRPGAFRIGLSFLM